MINYLNNIMTSEHNKHLTSILESFNNDAIKKYTKGAEQHGGNLWEKKDLIDKAIEEALDQVIYLYTLKQQIENNTIYSVIAEDID